MWRGAKGSVACGGEELDSWCQHGCELFVGLSWMQFIPYLMELWLSLIEL